MKEFFKYTLATLCGMMLFGVVSFVLMIVMMGSMVALSASGTESTQLKSHSVYRLDLEGQVTERNDQDEYTAAVMKALKQDQEVVYGLDDILENIQKAKDNANIDGIYLKGGSLLMGPATAEAIRRALLDFRASGKFIVAYADSYGQNSYYLASVADKVLVNPDGALDWKGIGMTLEFFPRLLQKLGVEMQVVKVGTFKSAVEPYILTEMSEPNRLQYTMLANDLWAERLNAVSASRGISVDSLNMLADRYMAVQPQTDYVTSGLVDSLCYLEDLEQVLTQLCGTDDYHLVSHDDMLSVSTDSSKANGCVAILYAEGDITDATGDGIVGKEMVKTIAEMRDDDKIDAVVLRVNSGGGSAYASEQIHHALALLKEQKPLVVSMGDYAASGGYYISCNADYIVAEQTTLTGSIGIFGLIPCVRDLTQKVGIDFDGVATNAHSDFENNMVLKGMNSEERGLMQAEINRGYDLFTRRCAEGRGVSQDDIKSIAEGRVWSGVRALEIGLVDSLGGIDVAVKKAAELAGLTSWETEAWPEQEDPFTEMLNALTGVVDDDRVMARRLGKEAYQTYRYMQQLKETPSVQARLPYCILQY